MNSICNDVLKLIMIDYLRWNDILSCLKTSKIFHVLTKKQIRRKMCLFYGINFCIKNGFLEETKLLIESNYCGQQSFSELFLDSCKLENKEIIKYLYSLLKGNIYKFRFLNNCPVENLKYIFPILTEKHKKEIIFDKYDFENLMISCNCPTDKLNFLYSNDLLNFDIKDDEYKYHCAENRRYKKLNWLIYKESNGNILEYAWNIYPGAFFGILSTEIYKFTRRFNSGVIVPYGITIMIWCGWNFFLTIINPPKIIIPYVLFVNYYPLKLLYQKIKSLKFNFGFNFLGKIKF
jgi:hypothetical protein